MNKKEKCSASQSNRIVINNGFEEKRVYKDELPYYESIGWSVGVSESHRNKMSSARNGKEPWNKGISPSASTRDKISKSLLGNVPWNKGLTKETDSRVRQYGEKQQGVERPTCKGRKLTEEHRRKISLSNVGKKHHISPEKLKIKLAKDYITKKLHNTFNTSSTEDVFYKQLLSEKRK